MARKPKRDLTVEEQLARGPMDLPFLMLVMILLGIGLIMMFSASYATAYYLAFMLQQMCDNVHLLTTSTSDLPTALSDVHPEDCLLVISYARYTSSSYDIVSHFHRAGCKIVALTDSLTSPIALKATEVLIAPNGGNFSPVGAITLCNCFITSLGRLNAQQTLERMELQDKIALEHHIYL